MLWSFRVEIDHIIPESASVYKDIHSQEELNKLSFAGMCKNKCFK